MTETQIGKMIGEMRKEKKIGREALARGLCSGAQFSSFEKGERKLDNLLIYRIFDRIGIEADEFALMVDETQYAYYLWRDQAYKAVEQADWVSLEKLLEDKETALGIEYNEKLQQQYYYKMKAILEAEKNHNYSMAVEFLEKAIEQTMPDVFAEKWKKICLGENELHLLMLYLYYGAKAGCLEKAFQDELYGKLENYITREHMEAKKLSRLYPKLVCIWMHIVELSLEERIKLCENAIQILKETRRLYDIMEVLRIYVEILEKRNSKKHVYYQKHYENFMEIFGDAGIECGFRPELLAGRREKMFLITEYLKSMRNIKGMTQQEASDNICEPETYSRIETGKHAPAKTNMRLLTERLGISWCFYRCEIEISSFKAYRVYQMVKKCSNRGLRGKNLKRLEELELLLDMTNPVNVQYLAFEKTIAKCRWGIIDEKRAYKQLEEALILTTVLPSDNQFRYYSQTELEILGYMAQLLCKQKKYEEGIELLENVIRNQRKSKVSWEYQWNGMDFVLRILGDLYFGVQRYEEANDIIKYVKRINLEQREAICLPHLLDCLADNYEHLGEQYSKMYKELYCQTYYVAAFFQFENIYPLAKKIYEEKFDKEKKWY